MKIQRNREGVALLALVLCTLFLGGLLAIASHRSTSELVRSERRRLLGDQARQLAENLVEEGLFTLFVRINNPRESALYRPDLYTGVRSREDGLELEYTIEPILAARTELDGAFRLDPILARIEIAPLRTVQAGTRLVGSEPRTVIVPPGTSSLGCFTLGGYSVQPIWQRVGNGRVSLEARVETVASSPIQVQRQLEVEYPVQLIRVSEDPPLSIVNIVPVQERQVLSRRFGKDA